MSKSKITAERIDPQTRKVVVETVRPGYTNTVTGKEMPEQIYTDEFEVPNYFVPLTEPLGYNPKTDQGRDGQAHLTYYDLENLLSYVWDGRSDYIEVAHGGYAEPTVAHVLIDPDLIDVDDDLIDVFMRHVVRDES